MFKTRDAGVALIASARFLWKTQDHTVTPNPRRAWEVVSGCYFVPSGALGKGWGLLAEGIRVLSVSSLTVEEIEAAGSHFMLLWTISSQWS